MERPKIGLALSGGAARGIAHLGVLKVLLENEIPIDYVTGVSAGAIVGGGFASGLGVEEQLKLVEKLSWFDIGKFSYSLFGLQSNEPLEKFISENYPAKTFAELKIPFATIATDLDTGEMIVFDKGNLAKAIRASATLPGLYVPVVDEENRKLIDGGIVAAVPTNLVRQLGADIVIAVDVTTDGTKFFGTPSTAVGVLLQSIYLLLRNSVKTQLQSADIVISPNLSEFRFDEIHKSKEFVEKGEIAARELIPQIKELIALKSANF